MTVRFIDQARVADRKLFCRYHVVCNLLVVGRGVHLIKYLQAFGANVVLTHQAEPGMRAALGYFLAAQRCVGATAVFNNVPLAGDLHKYRVLFVHCLIVAWSGEGDNVQRLN